MHLKFIKTGAAAAALLTISSAALAADVPPRRVSAYATVAPRAPWNGFYLGLNLGYGVAGISDSTALAVSSMMYGVIGGVQAGYNYQAVGSSLVWGLEADFQATSMSNSLDVTVPGLGAVSVGHKIPWFGTLRGRLGYAFDCQCVMAYLTGGVAYGAYEPYATALGITVSRTYTRAALALGAGVEWKVAQQWTAKIEGMYIDTGNFGTGLTLPVIGEINARARVGFTRLGVNYHF
jgi:outer membrane immunogenic protein